jgi:hypothetical protein
MISLQHSIEATVASWIESGDILSSKDINDGLCADFASSIAENLKCEIVGVYDLEDIGGIKGQVSKSFRMAVESDWVGHTALYHDGKFFDSETPSGVSRFEDLPVNQRAMN